jgi:hypothetical protein
MHDMIDRRVRAFLLRNLRGKQLVDLRDQVITPILAGIRS